jgi:hypothetical protein
MRPTLAAALVVVLTGCGAEDPPRDASEAEFCDGFRKVSAQTSWAKTQDAVGELREVGTPGEIPRDAREGFLAITEQTAEAEDRAALVEKVEALGENTKRQVDAFNRYVRETCPTR